LQQTGISWQKDLYQWFGHPVQDFRIGLTGLPVEIKENLTKTGAKMGF